MAREDSSQIILGLKGEARDRGARWVREHGLGAMVYQTFDEADYKQDYLKNRNTNIILLDEFDKIQNEYSKSGKVFRGIKGIDLCRLLYSDISLRPMTDIDVLTDGLDAKRLLPMGYSQIDEGKWLANRHKRSFTKSTNGIEVTFELHNSLFFDEPLSESEFNNLSAEVYFVYLCTHYVQQHSMLKLFWLVDLELFLKKVPLDAEKLFVEAKRFNRVRSVNFALSAIRAMGGSVEIPFTPCQWVSRKFLIAPRSNLFRYYWIKHFCRESLWDSLIYDFHWLRNWYYISIKKI